MQDKELNNKSNIKQDIDYTKIVKIILSRWYWVASTIFISVLLAYIYLWYTPPSYSTSASLKFEEKRSEISELLNVRNVYDRTNKIASETFVISSREVLNKAASLLNYDVSYFLKGRIRTKDLYPQKPFHVEIIDRDTTSYYTSPIELTTINSNNFELAYNLNGVEHAKIYNFNQIISLPNIKFRIALPAILKLPKGVTYVFKFNTKSEIISRLRSGLSMMDNKNTNILNIVQTDSNPFFATDGLNAIINSYVRFDRKQRSQSAHQTILFIDTLLRNMANVVASSGKKIEQFKVDNQMLDISSGSEKILKEITDFENQKRNLNLQELIISQVKQAIINNKDENLINFNLQGISDPQMLTLINIYNDLIKQRTDGLQSFKPTSTFITQIDKMLIEVKTAFLNNVKIQQEKNKETIKYLNLLIAKTKQNFNTIPKAERNYIDLQANFNINQKVYSFLSEKKLEAQISKAAVTPGSVIVDLALVNSFPISPIPRKTYTFALFAGLLAGIGLIFLVRLLNPFIYDKETIESLTNIPIIGIIRKYPGNVSEDNREIVSIKNPKSLFAESVRSVRTNLSFLAAEKAHKVVCITSEVSGEGKSFTTINLASTLSLIDKKIIIIAADLRKSKLHKTFQVNNLKGLSSYLSNQSTLEEIIYKTEIENMNFIPAGPMPPNPSELLYSSKMKDLITDLSADYDFVIIDSAPVGLVSDTAPLIRMADINLFVIRSGVSKYYAASVPERLSKEFGLNNIAIILNAFDNDILHSRYYSTNYSGSSYVSYYYYTDFSNYDYEGGYYSDEMKKRKWWEIWKKS